MDKNIDHSDGRPFDLQLAVALSPADRLRRGGRINPRSIVSALEVSKAPFMMQVMRVRGQFIRGGNGERYPRGAAGSPDNDDGELGQLLSDLSDLRVWILRRSAHSRHSLAARGERVAPEDLASIANLRHYLAFRSRDLRPLQDRLSRLGCSSLGRSEAHVIDAVERVLNLLRRILLPQAPIIGLSGQAVDRRRGYELLARNTDRLLGPEPAGRVVRIMVTMPSEAADDYGLVRQLAVLGMDVARINCAHDHPEAWLRMIGNIRKAAAESGRSITIAADLAGHKIRTGELEREVGVLHLTPRRDRLGRVLSPARLRLLKGGVGIGDPAPGLPVQQAVLAWDREPGPELEPGDRLSFIDSRGARRTALVDQVDAEGVWVTLHQATYLINGLSFLLRRDAGQTDHQVDEWGGSFVGIPDQPVSIRLRRTDRLLLTREPLPGREELRNDNGFPVAPARIACTMPRVFDVLRVGQAVWIDDGKFGAKVIEIGEEGALLEITDCRPGGARLQSDKGLNFPGLELGLPGLAHHDLAALKVLAGQVDIINYSFVETGRQVGELLTVLRQLGAEDTGIVAKIETARAFNNLAEIALAAMGRAPFGIMIARGDLAVEVGPERLAEVQEEILWLAEAAHLPVVWATQVLETMVKKGVISRPELTDAAMAERAECVMLNKGPFIEKALKSLHDILSRMREHQRKKSSRLRALCWGRSHFNVGEPLKPPSSEDLFTRSAPS